MTAAENGLPSGFESLEAFVETWASEDAAGRAQARMERSETERAAFYEAVQPRLPEALARLDAKPLAELDPAEERLMNLLLAFAHVAMAVEVQGEDEPRFAELSRHMHITRASADEALQAKGGAR